MFCCLKRAPITVFPCLRWKEDTCRRLLDTLGNFGADKPQEKNKHNFIISSQAIPTNQHNKVGETGEMQWELHLMCSGKLLECVDAVKVKHVGATQQHHCSAGRGSGGVSVQRGGGVRRREGG